MNMRDPDNRDWAFVLGKEFYERGNRERIDDIGIDEIQMLETFYDHLYGSSPHYIQKVESRESVRQMLFGNSKN